jgi:hypothetical protein
MIHQIITPAEKKNVISQLDDNSNDWNVEVLASSQIITSMLLSSQTITPNV